MRRVRVIRGSGPNPAFNRTPRRRGVMPPPSSGGCGEPVNFDSMLGRRDYSAP